LPAVDALEAAAWVLGAYLAIGAVFAPLFVTRLVGRIDPDAAQGSWGFRLAITPGVVALWPWMLVRVLRGGEPCERGPHLDAAEKR